MLTTAPAVTFDGRDVAEDPVPDEVVGFGMLACPTCGTPRDPRFPFCCEFAAEALAQPLAVAR